MSLFFIVGLIHDSNNQSQNKLRIFGTSTANNTEDPSTCTFNTLYLLHGLNDVLYLFLSTFIFPLYKKSHLSKRTNGNCMTHGEKKILDESHKQD